MRKHLSALVVIGLFSAVGSTAAFADPSQPPQGQGAPLAVIKNASPDSMGRYQDLVGKTAVSAWADSKSGGHANVCNVDGGNTNGNQPGDGC